MGLVSAKAKSKRSGASAAAKKKSPAKPKKRRTMDRDERRQTLLDAAGDLFSRQGYHETTVDDITSAAGVAKGTFYLYFNEKRAIYNEVIRAFLDRIKEASSFAQGGPPNPLTFFDRAVEGARQLMEVVGNNRPLARMAYRESMGLDPELSKLMRDFYAEIAELEANNIRVAMQLGVVRECDPTLTAYIHIGMAERIVLELIEHPEDFPPVEEVVNQLMFIGYEGIRGPNGPAWPYREPGRFGKKGEGG